MNFLKLKSHLNAGRLVKVFSRNHVTTHHTIIPRDKDERWKGKG